MDWKEHFEVNPEVENGKPVIKGTHFSLEYLYALMAEGASRKELLENYPILTPAILEAAMQMATEAVNEKFSL